MEVQEEKTSLFSSAYKGVYKIKHFEKKNKRSTVSMHVSKVSWPGWHVQDCMFTVVP